jgi:hypothetical protein
MTMTTTASTLAGVAPAGISTAQLYDAMSRVAAALAVALAADDGIDSLGVTEFVLAHAGRQPVSLAATCADLCAALGIAPAAWVARALG